MGPVQILSLGSSGFIEFAEPAFKKYINCRGWFKKIIIIFFCWFCCQSYPAMHIVVWVTLSFAVLILVICLPLSFQSVNYDEVGITMYVPSRSVSDEVLPTGRYFLVIPTTLFRYKVNVRPRNEDLHCLTADGEFSALFVLFPMPYLLEILLNVSQVSRSALLFWNIHSGIAIELMTKLQIQLIANETLNAFFELGDEEKLDQFSSVVVRESFRDSCSRFPLNDFFRNRVTVEKHMMQLLSLRLREANAHVVVLNVQLLNIAAPTEVLHSIKAAEVARQDIEKARRERIQVAFINVCFVMAMLVDPD